MKYRFEKASKCMNKIKDIEWVWEPFIPKSCVSLLAARGGIGKSAFALWLADDLCSKGLKIAYIDAERCGMQFKSRIDKWNLKNYQDIEFMVTDCVDGSLQTGAPSKLSEIKEVLEDHSSNFDLIILDSLTMLTRFIDANQRGAVANFFSEVTEIAAANSTGILFLAHLKKKQHLDDIISLDSIAGSAAITDLSRSVIIMDEGKVEGDKVITHNKANLSAKAKDFVFSMEADGIKNIRFEDTVKRETGTKQDRFNILALELLNKGLNKKELIKELKDVGASNLQHGIAIKHACAKLHISFE